ncbi:SGNH/GDSL hydrolase family protein [Pigmentibacter sp. JX0631]|uniref:SGNH/GDSL hydrolase family protein n=1 Tax=Pigmentibacter sp. JX0631 TaxID=2976982 RepID=UPI0024685AA4|nr:SGNH/GDSL hydrolase family protein [Pigmentibacter sp. JX0631]WGL59594.1 SGNH/GDSL hydrolase family protein [Pigmentibacter sp. JX0631]
MKLTFYGKTCKKICFSFFFLVSSYSYAKPEPEYIKNLFNSEYYVACYYHDQLQGLENSNPNLMYPSLDFLTFGARKNYVWAIKAENSAAVWTKLSGKITDGFFIEEKLSYQDLQNQCNYALKNKFPTQKYDLFEMKASTSDLAGYEYPIQFTNSEISQQKIKQIVLFGDSLSDAGNLKRWTKIMPFYPFWFGRFADGFVWNDYLTERTHLPVLNFAYGGAKTDGTNDAFNSSIPTQFITAVRSFFTGSSKYYVNSYLKSYLTIDSYRTTNQKISNPNETLFIIWIGANDFLEKFEGNLPAQNMFENPDAVGGVNFIYKRAVDNILEQIKMLNNAGGYHFLVLNLPDLGKTPIILTANYNKYQDDEKNKAEFSIKLSEGTAKFNFYLDSALKNLQDSQKEKINIKLLDINSDFERIMNNKNIFDDSYFDYGFTKLDSKYLIPKTKNYIQEFCYSGNYFKTAFTNIGKETILMSVKENKCSDESGNRIKYPIFFNSPHPSAYAQCWVNFAVEKIMIENGLLNKKQETMNEMKKYCQAQMN